MELATVSDFSAIIPALYFSRKKKRDLGLFLWARWWSGWGKVHVASGSLVEVLIQKMVFQLVTRLIVCPTFIFHIQNQTQTSRSILQAPEKSYPCSCWKFFEPCANKILLTTLPAKDCQFYPGLECKHVSICKYFVSFFFNFVQLL